MGKGSGNRQGAVTRALFFSVRQECASPHEVMIGKGLGLSQPSKLSRKGITRFSQDLAKETLLADLQISLSSERQTKRFTRLPKYSIIQTLKLKIGGDVYE